MKRKPDPVSAAPSVEALVATWREKAAVNLASTERLPHADLKLGASCWAECRRECADELEAALPALNEALTALSFAEGAILDAISLEDGLDGGAGEAVMRMIRAALLANGREPITIPPEDEPGDPPYQTTEQRLAALTAGGWQPIETAPKDGTHILATNGRFEPTSVHWHVDGWYLSVNMHEAYADYEAQWGPLTLWQPLPPLPSAPTETK